MEYESRERRTSRAGQDGESFDRCEYGGSKDAEVEDDLWRWMEEDEFIGGETGKEFVQRELECPEKQTHLADIVEFPCEGLCLLEGESASKEGNAKGIGGGDELFVGETPGECPPCCPRKLSQSPGTEPLGEYRSFYRGPPKRPRRWDQWESRPV